LTEVDVKIQVSRPDGKKMIVAKEGSDLYIICKTSANDVSVEWTMNDYIPLTKESDRIEMMSRDAPVNGQLHTLIIRDTTRKDTAMFKCQVGSAADEVEVRIVKVASKQLTCNTRVTALEHCEMP